MSGFMCRCRPGQQFSLCVVTGLLCAISPAGATGLQCRVHPARTTLPHSQCICERASWCICGKQDSVKRGCEGGHCLPGTPRCASHRSGCICQVGVPLVGLKVSGCGCSDLLALLCVCELCIWWLLYEYCPGGIGESVLYYDVPSGARPCKRLTTFSATAIRTEKSYRQGCSVPG